MRVIYLDHNATTPLLPEVAEAMAPWQGMAFGNPASQHQVGRRARQAVEDARETIGQLLGARLSGHAADRVIFTSGGSEANNLAILGLAGGQSRPSEPGEAVISAIEHPSVAAPAELLERRGWTVHRLRVAVAGTVEGDSLSGLLNQRTRLVSVMLANNETGVVQPLAELIERAAARGVLVHTDAVQMVGKQSVDFHALGVDLMSAAAHKFHGPQGIGVLIVRHGAQLDPLLVGGLQQEGLRPGTEPVALAVGMAAALAAFQREKESRPARMAMLRDRLEARLAADLLGQIVINGAAAPRVPHTSNVGFLGFDRQALLMALDLAGIACSSGSACASGSSQPSTVLAAMGASPEVLAGSLRFSLGAMTTVEDIDEAVERIVATCQRIAKAAQPLSR